MPIYIAFLGHVELPRVDVRRPPSPADARVDRRPSTRLRGRTESS
jgi:hypothetical protein